MIGARGTDLVFRTRLAMRDWLLRLPAIVLPDALPPAGERVIAMAGLHNNHWYATVHSSRGVRHVEIPFAVSLGWTFFLIFDHPLGPGDGWINALWLAALVFPAALWGSIGRGRDGGARVALSRREAFNRWWLLGLEFEAAALLLIPAFARFAPASPWEWGGLILGATSGALAAPVIVRSGRAAR